MNPNTSGSQPNLTEVISPEHHNPEVLRDIRVLLPHLTEDRVEAMYEISIRFDEAFQPVREDAVRALYFHEESERNRLADLAASTEAETVVEDDVELLVREIMADNDESHYTDEELDALEHRVRSAIFVAASIDQDTWEGTRDRRKKKYNGDGLFDDLMDIAADHADTPEEDDLIGINPEDIPDTPEIAEIRDNLARARFEKQIASAELQTLPFWRIGERRAIEERYERALLEYEEELHDLQTALAIHLKDKGISDEDRYDYLDSIVTDCVKGDIQQEREIMLEQGGLSARLLDRFANASRGKKIAIMLGATALSIGGGIVLGGIGAGVASTIVIMGTARIARAYALEISKIYGPRGDLESFVRDEDDEDMPKAQEQASKYLRTHSNGMIKEAQKIRNRAITISAATAVVGGTAGWFIHESGAFDFLSDKVHALSDAQGGGGEAARDAINTVPTTPNVTDTINHLTGANPTLSEFVSSHLDATGNLTVPVEPGDGFIAISERIGLDNIQMDRLIEVAQSHTGETYMAGADPRLYLNDGKLLLNPQEAIYVLSGTR